MKTLLIAAILAAGPAIAAESMIARAGENSLRLYDKPCVNAAILEQIKDDYRAKFRAGHAVVGKQDFEACWLVQDEQVFVLYSDGDRSIIPLSAFKPDGV